MATLATILGWVVTIVTALWTALCNVGNIARQEIRRFVIAEMITLGIALGLMLIGFLCEIDGLVVIMGVISAIVWLVAWKSTDIFVQAIRSLGSRLPIVGTAVNATADELHKLVSPLLTASTAFAFIGAVVAVKGTGYISWHAVVILATGALFLNILTYYYNSTTKWAGGIMAGIYGFIFVAGFAFPMQMGGAIDFIEGWSFNTSMRFSKNGQQGYIAIIKTGTPLFDEKGGKFSVSGIKIDADTKAKVMTRKPTMVSGEAMLKITLPVKGYKDLYVGGEQAWVPSRMTTPEQMPELISNNKSSGKVKFEREYTGQGWGEDDWVPTASCNTDAKIGSQLIITGKEFEIFDRGRWNRCYGKYEFTNTIAGDGFIGVKADKGQPFKVTVING